MDLGILGNRALVSAASKELGKECALAGCDAILNGGKRMVEASPSSGSEPLKLLSEGRLRTPGVDRLLLAHHVDHLDSTHDCTSTVYRLEPENRPHSPFDGLMILFE